MDRDGIMFMLNTTNTNLKFGVAMDEELMSELDSLMQELMIHNSSVHSAEGRQWSCGQSFYFRLFLGYFYFPLLLICLFGNTLNIMVYAQTSLRKSMAIQLLTFKAIVNTLFMVCLVTSAMHIIADDIQLYSPTFEYIYFNSWPYMLMLSNTFGSYAMWLTVLMTFERYLIVIYPIRSRNWSTPTRFYKACLFLLPCCISLALVYPIAKHVKTVVHLDPFSQTEYVLYEFTLRQGKGYALYEKICHTINLVFFILLPLLLLTIMSVRLSWNLLVTKSNKQHHISEKKCVTRISLATTLAHLVLELPTTLPLLNASLNGSIDHTATICAFSIIANFLSMCSASALFFIYVACSSKFRTLAVMRLQCRSEPNHISTRMTISTTLDERSAMLSRVRNGARSQSHDVPTCHMMTDRQGYRGDPTTNTFRETYIELNSSHEDPCTTRLRATSNAPDYKTFVPVHDAIVSL